MLETNGVGISPVSLRAGLLPSDQNVDYHVSAAFNDIHGTPATGSPLSFTVSAGPPTAGTIFTFVNIYHTSAQSEPLPRPAAVTHLYNAPRGVAVKSDGTIYFSTDCAIRSVSTDGVLSAIAGTDSCGSSLAEGGPATSAQVYNVRGLALDETSNFLYYADMSNNLVRYVNLTDKTVHTFAGGGSSSLPAPYGDGSSPTNAYIPQPTELSIHGDNLYITDAGHGSIRYVDSISAGGGNINMWWAPQGGSATCGNTPIALYSCGSNDQSCNIIWDGSTAYVAGYFCGTSASYFQGVVSTDATATTRTRIAGNSVANTADNILPTTASFSTIPQLAMDANKVLYLSVQSEHRIRKFSTTGSPSITTIAGTNGSAGYSGDYVASTGALLYNPAGLAMKNGHLVFADTNNYCIREIW